MSVFKVTSFAGSETPKSTRPSRVDFIQHLAQFAFKGRGFSKDPNPPAGPFLLTPRFHVPRDTRNLENKENKEAEMADFLSQHQSVFYAEPGDEIFGKSTTPLTLSSSSLSSDAEYFTAEEGFESEDGMTVEQFSGSGNDSDSTERQFSSDAEMWEDSEGEEQEQEQDEDGSFEEHRRRQWSLALPRNLLSAFSSPLGTAPTSAFSSLATDTMTYRPAPAPVSRSTRRLFSGHSDFGDVLSGNDSDNEICGEDLAESGSRTLSEAYYNRDPVSGELSDEVPTRPVTPTSPDAESVETADENTSPALEALLDLLFPAPTAASSSPPAPTAGLAAVATITAAIVPAAPFQLRRSSRLLKSSSSASCRGHCKRPYCRDCGFPSVK